MTAPSWEQLDALVRAGDVADRAFAGGVARLRAHQDPRRARGILAAARARAHAEHAALRAAIRSGATRGAAFRERLERVPPAERDAWIEEVLDVAHPPLDERPLDRELVPYVPSGVAEIVHALDATGLAAGDTLVDLGAGMGKVLLLTALLTGARAHGVEIDGRLAAAARDAAAGLGLDGVTMHHGDARAVDPGPADLFFLYVPFTGAVLRAVLDRLEPAARARRAHLCASPLDLVRHPWLAPAGLPCGWMEIYRAR